jgi:CheY-like chemotaxis protein
MRIVVADDDPVSRRLVEYVITTRTGHEVVTVTDGDRALDLALAEPTPDVLILDWVMPTMNGTEVCRQVRRAPLPVQPYVLLITAKTKRDEVIEGLSVGADDLLTKPLPPDLLIARLKLARRRPTPGKPRTRAVLQALVDAAAEGDGELVIRDRDTTARVFLHRGKVAWAHVSDDPSGLFDILDPERGMDQDTVREVVEECRRTRARLSDTLVRWGLVDRARLRDCLLAWTSRKIAGVRQFSNPQSLFLPAVRNYAEDLLFDLEELVGADDLKAVSASSPPPENAALAPRNMWETAFVSEIPISIEDSELMDRCMLGGGVKGVAVIDRASGRCLGQRGARLNPDIVWAHIQCLNAVAAQEHVADTVVATDRHYHLVRPLAERKDAFVYVLVKSSEVRLADARLNLARALGVIDDPVVETATALATDAEVAALIDATDELV